MSWFSEKYGLLCEMRGYVLPSENAALFSVEYLLRKGTPTDLLYPRLIEWTRMCKDSVLGVYDNRPWLDGGHEDYISKDNLLAHAAFLKLMGREEEIKGIWDYLKSHYFTYNNLTGKTDFKRFMGPHEKSILCIGVLAGNEWLRYPMREACKFSLRKFDKDNASGALKAYVCLKITNDSKIDKYEKKYVGSWDTAFDYYFYREGNPLRSK